MTRSWFKPCATVAHPLTLESTSTSQAAEASVFRLRIDTSKNVLACPTASEDVLMDALKNPELSAEEALVVVPRDQLEGDPDESIHSFASREGHRGVHRALRLTAG